MTTARTRNRPAKPADNDSSETRPPQAFDAASLLASATIVSRESNHRETVEVDPAVVAFAQKLYDTKQAAKFPVADATAFAAQKLMWQSAADKTTPLTSATVTEIREVHKDSDGKPVFEQATDDNGNKLYIYSGVSGTRESFGDNFDQTEPLYNADPVMNTVGLRVSFGQRRGQKKTAETPPPATS